MKLRITVHGVAYEVEVEVLDAGEGLPDFAADATLPPIAGQPVLRPSAGAPSPPAPAAAPRSSGAAPVDGAGAVVAPIAGVVQEVRCRPGDTVTAGQILLVIEAMKMLTQISAPVAGRIRAIPVAAGDAVREGAVLVELE